jgi:WD repeat-containing protein 26
VGPAWCGEEETPQDQPSANHSVPWWLDRLSGRITKTWNRLQNTKTAGDCSTSVPRRVLSLCCACQIADTSPTPNDLTWLVPRLNPSSSSHIPDDQPRPWSFDLRLPNPVSTALIPPTIPSDRLLHQGIGDGGSREPLLSSIACRLPFPGADLGVPGARVGPGGHRGVFRGVVELAHHQNPPQSQPAPSDISSPDCPSPATIIASNPGSQSVQASSTTPRYTPPPQATDHRGPNPTGDTSIISEGEEPRRVLGRRQRSPGDLDGGPVDEHGTEQGIEVAGGLVGGFSLPPPETSDSANLRAAKRRRTTTMLADDGETRHSNGMAAGRGFSQGSTSQAHGAAGRVSTNGTVRTAAVNGSGAHPDKDNGTTVRASSPTYLGHDREEVTRLLIQALHGMGYDSIAQSLSRESGYELENGTVAAFRVAILDGSWARAEELLSLAVMLGEDGDDITPPSGPNGLVLSPGSDRDAMRFWIRQQKYLELLEEGDNPRALRVLRSQLTPLRHDTDRLHSLSALLFCKSAEALRTRAEWDGAKGTSRHALLSQLSKCISPSVMLPEDRLAGLLQQVKQRQIDTCLYHTAASSPSLYSDHFCDKTKFPSELALTLTDLEGEIWQILFSNSGKWLAACGGIAELVVWNVPEFSVAATLVHDNEHKTMLTNLSWSPDDSYLVSCSKDRTAKIWDTKVYPLA